MNETIKTKEQRKIRVWTKLSGKVLGMAVTLLLFFFAEIPTSYAVVTFANNGLSEPFYWLTRPTSVYYNSKTYIVWHGAGYDPYITYYDHATKTWAQVKRVADNPMVNNGHGAPAMTIDSSGYIHVFYGATIAGGFPLKHAISNSPESISAFTVKPNIGMYNYPKPINIGNSLYLFAMGPSDPAYLSYLIWNGASWGPTHGPIITARSGANTYVGFMEYNNNKVHVTWIYTYEVGRRNVFYAYLSLTDMNMYSITGRNLGTTIDATEAETYCMVRNTGAGQSNTASMHFDSNGYPWIIYPEGSGTTWKFYHTRWNGSAWTAPKFITTTDERFNYEDFIINNDNDVTAYLTTSGAPGPGGDIEQWHWDGSVWSKVSTILSESASGKPLGGPNIPYNFNPELDLVFSQFLDDIFTDSTLKLYADLGISSTPLPIPSPTLHYVTPTIYCLGSCPTLAPTQRPTQISPTTSSQKIPPCSSYGDVNNDGYVTTVDAEIVLKYAIGSLTPTAEQKKRSDVDADGIVSASDALMILRYANGTTTTFPVCPGTPQSTLTPATSSSPSITPPANTPVSQTPNTSPAPTINPCVTVTPAVSANSANNEAAHRKQKKSNNSKKGIIQQLLQLIKWLIEQLLQLIGIGVSPTPSALPTPAPSAQPSQSVTPQPGTPGPTLPLCEPSPAPIGATTTPLPPQ